MYIGLHIKYLLSLSDSNETLIFLIDIRMSLKYIQFHENLSSGSQVVPRGRTDMTKLIVAFCDVVNTSKNKHV
jgi:hypothetical protein